MLVGAAVVLVGHAVVVWAGSLLDGPDPVIYYSAIVVLMIGAIQLVYVIPLLAYGLWRRRYLAVGAATVAVATVAFTAVGLLH